MTSKRSDISRRSAWTKGEIRAARQKPLKSVLERLGYHCEPCHDGNYIVHGLPNEILVKDHFWICAEDGQAGNAIDFLVNIRGMPFSKAMELLTS